MAEWQQAQVDTAIMELVAPDFVLDIRDRIAKMNASAFQGINADAFNLSLPNLRPQTCALSVVTVRD
jgi:hypothetical protein